MNYHLRTKPFDHQKIALKRALAHPQAFAYLAETGTGKTPMLLAEFQHRVAKGEINDLLVLAPAGSIRNWFADKSDYDPSELRKHLDPAFFEKLFIIVNSKKAAWRARQKQMLSIKQPRALFVNIEAVSRGNSTNPSDAEILCRQLLNDGKCMMVIDESTTIRSKSLRTRSVLRLGKLAHCRRIMTGLVTPRSPLDLYYQMNFLDPNIIGISSFTAFRARYAQVEIICREPQAIVDMRLRQAMNRKKIKLDISSMSYYQKVNKILELGGWIDHVPMITDYKNIDELQKKIAPYCYQILKKDCLDLWPKMYEFRYITLNPEQKRVYNDILADASAQLNNGKFVTANSVISQMIRLHQVTCGHVKDEEGNLHDLGNNRIAALIDILNEHEGKAIIWVKYDFELRRIARALLTEYGKDSVATFWGGNLKSRHLDETKFLTDPKCRFMVSTPMTGGKGNTWNVATLAIYAANSHDLEHRYQSEDRCHRIGQENKVTYIDLMVPNTVEEKIIHALRKKIDLATTITGEGWREWLI
jgi:Mesyanzhinovviridae DNA helicase